MLSQALRRTRRLTRVSCIWLFGEEGWALLEEDEHAEEARVAIRQVRKDANDEIKKSQKESGKSEDDIRREQEETQKLTDRYIHQVEEILKHKEAEVMEV